MIEKFDFHAPTGALVHIDAVFPSQFIQVTVAAALLI